MSETVHPLGSRVWTSRPPKKTPRWHPVRAVVAGLVVAALVASMSLAVNDGQLPSFDLASADPSGPASGGAASDVVPGQLLVRFADDAPGNATSRARSEVGAEVVNRIEQLGVEVWRVPEHAADRALAGLQRNPHVTYAELDTTVELDEVTPNDPWFGHQWGLRTVGAPAAWATTTGSPDVTIAILDTGVMGVPDLAAKLLPGYNTLDGTDDVTDNTGHGTQAAGVAAAVTDNAHGVAGYCWGCKILPVKVLDGRSGSMSDLAQGIVWAADSGADIISMSVSGPTGSSAVRQAAGYAKGQGSLLVASAGNEGTASARYPAAYPEVIGVAASDGEDERYDWSSYGAWVDVSAPGANRTTNRSGGVSLFTGTSSAAPAVAGVLGLALSLDVPPEAVREAAAETAHSRTFVAHGRVDAAGLLARLGSDGEPKGPPAEPGPTPEPPVADFAFACDELACDLEAATSDAPQGRTLTYGWNLGDGVTADGRAIQHEYLEAGKYAVTLMVTDEDGQTGSATKDVEVDAPAADPVPDPDPAPDPDPEPVEPDLALSVTPDKQRGVNHAVLSWDGAEEVTVYVGGREVRTIAGNTWTYDTGLRGSPTLAFRVCAADACSDDISVRF